MPSLTTVEQLAGRLGLAQTTLIGKADEYSRLVRLKLVSGNKISDSALAVVCLHFAAEHFAAPFDYETGLKLAAVKKSVYANYKHTIGKLLNIDTVINVNSLCVQLNCTDVCDLAVRIFDYCKSNCAESCDWSHPQFACIAVYKACKLEKVKISKSKFLENSRLKLAQWNELDSKWSNIISKSDFLHKNHKTTKEDKVSSIKSVSKENEEILNINKHDQKVPDEQEEYETWKRRILKEAYKEIENSTKSNNKINKDGSVTLYIKLKQK